MECFAGLGKAVVGVVAGIGSRAMRRATPDRNRAAPERLIQQAGQLPRQTTLRESTQVRQAAVDDSLQPPPAPLPVQHRPVNEQIVTAYARNLTEVSAGLSQLSSQAQSQGLTQPQQTELKRVASEHVDAVTHSLPAAFGMQPGAIKDWLLNYNGDASAIASALRTYLTDQLGQSGHGAAAAQWLYQQVLSAGSTCLASQATEPSRQRQYLDAAANEVRQLSTVLNGPGGIQRLIEGWSQGRQAEQDNEKLWALQRYCFQDQEPNSDSSRAPSSSKKPTKLDDPSFSEDDDQTASAHSRFICDLNKEFSRTQRQHYTGCSPSVRHGLLGSLETALYAKLSRLGDAQSLWSRLRSAEDCPDWRAVITLLEDARSINHASAGDVSQCEKWIYAWCILKKNTDKDLSSVADAQRLFGKLICVCGEEENDDWEKMDPKLFPKALEVIQTHKTPAVFDSQVGMAPVNDSFRTHSNAEAAPKKSANPKAEEVHRGTAKKSNQSSVTIEAGKQPQSVFLNNLGAKSGPPAIGVTRNMPGKAASGEPGRPPAKTGNNSGEANKATGSLQNTPKDVSSREPQERVADDGQALVIRKKKRKPAKTNEGKQPKSGQLSPMEGDGKPKVAASKGASTATQSPKVSTVETYHDDVAKGKQAALDRFSDGMDKLKAELQASPSTVPATPKKQALAGSKLPNALDDSSIGQ